MKPTPLSSVLADDLLLDRIGARLDTDDELGSMLLAVAHSADTPIPRPIVGRRVRRHRGLTVLAALGVAVSGATVAAAVELGPVPPDQASGVPHSRSLLPPGLQDLVMPFLNGTPFQGRFVLPNGTLPTVPTSGSATAAGLPGAVLSTRSVCRSRPRPRSRRPSSTVRTSRRPTSRPRPRARRPGRPGRAARSSGPDGRGAGRPRRAGRADRRRSRAAQAGRSRSRPRRRTRPTRARCRRPTRATARSQRARQRIGQRERQRPRTVAGHRGTTQPRRIHGSPAHRSTGTVPGDLPGSGAPAKGKAEGQAR